MKLPCFLCNGSGWSHKYPAGLLNNGIVNKEMFILIPCIDCKGQGLKEFKYDDSPGSGGGSAKEIKET
jgi:hypothetical protein